MGIISGYFSDDMTSEILSRLPAKSLMRFWCVCKSWYSLATNISFISKHVKNYNQDNTRLVIYYLHCDLIDSGFNLCLYTDKTLEDTSYKILNPQMPSSAQVLGPYDGIFFLYENNRMILWNLATKDYTILPKYKTNLPQYTKLYYPNVGFGFDPKRNEYKMILIRALRDEKRRVLCEFSHVALYTLGDIYYWKDFRDDGIIPFCLQTIFDSPYINGVCYWLAIGEDDSRKIISFNMEDETFREIDGPSIPESKRGILGLWNNDSLALLLFDGTDNIFEVWLMKESSWMKQITMGPLLGMRGPLGFWKNGKFIADSDGGQVLLCDPNTEIMKELGPNSFWLEVHKYKESLISVREKNSIIDTDLDIPWYIFYVYE